MSMKMEAEQINNKKEFISFLRSLQLDFKNNKDAWYNWTIDAYLERIAAWLDDQPKLNLEPSWSTFAIIISSGKYYE